ncbi:Putative oligopeptide transporter, OPT superfamily [Septoria linicola]|uniref:Oligopeptide transporter, OPT superfamily n=1 Tax=Septoria linicola TaxID=215465 RepID=A0A9Q9AJM3_9PEZI|nr:Putative oligopeptide transporter, OPT superfamily [Septoria linicola]
MANVNEVIDHTVMPMGNINPEVPPLTEKRNVFNTPTLHGTVEETLVDEKHASMEKETDKVGQTYVGEMEEVDFEKPGQEPTEADPFTPFDDLPEERHFIVTIRSILVGVICGALVNASNVYLGLKTGWTFGASLFGAIIGFAVLKPLGRKLPESFPIFGGEFGPRENNIVQTAATAAGGLSSVFISGIPALYQLELLSTPKEDFPRLITLTLVGGYFGFLMSTPLRKFFIIYVARELKLIFPTPSATAMTIRAMHMASTGEAIAKLKMRALSYAFSGAIILRVASQYATGILWDWHIFTWFYIWGNYNNAAINVENWGWMLEWTPAFIGAGMLVGLNTAISFYAGSIIAWGIIGPTLVHYNVAFGLAPAAYEGTKWEGIVSFASLGTAASSKDTPSPRFWMLWPGVLLMIVVSFVELGLQYKVFFHVSKAIYRGSCSGINAARKAMGRGSSPYLESKGAQKQDDLVKDFADDKDLVKWWMWFPALIAIIILTCVVMGVQFDMPVGMSLLSIFLAFFFSLLAVQCAGVTDITPLTAASKASQIVLGGATKGEGWEPEHAQRLNLLGGSLASIGANQASDLVGDFRVGFLLKTSPKQQWVAQGLGTIVAVFLAPALFMLFAKAYPCILDINAEVCPFSAPSVSAWRAVAVAMTDPEFPVPTSSGIFAICFSIFGAGMIFVRHYAYTGTWEKYRVYHPNMMCIGLAFVLPQTYYGLAMIIGAAPCYFWAKRNPQSFDIYGYAIAAGLIAGEGIGGVINAIFQVAGIAGPDPYGTNIACPGDAC